MRSRHGDMLPTIWAVGNRPPRPNHPRKIAFSWGPVSRHPSIEGNFIPQRYEPSSPPLEGWRLAAGVVRDYGIGYLLPCHSRTRGPRKYDRICGGDNAGILYPFSNNFCHSRAGGNRAWIVISYFILEIIQRCVFYL